MGKAVNTRNINAKTKVKLLSLVEFDCFNILVF